MWKKKSLFYGLYTAFLWKTFFSGKTEGYLPSSRVKLMQGGRTFLQKSGNGLRHHEQKNFCRTRIKNGNLLANKVGLCYTSK